MASRTRSAHGQASRFAAAGLANTMIDYVLFIGMTRVLSIPLEWVWIAKLFSGTVAILNSFILNRQWVFRGSGQLLREGRAFVTAAVIGVYVIQTPLTQLFASRVQAPGKIAFRAAEEARVTELMPAVITEAFLIKTVAFCIAGVATLTWNFLAYRHWVFGPWRIGFRGPYRVRS